MQPREGSTYGNFRWATRYLGPLLTERETGRGVAPPRPGKGTLCLEDPLIGGRGGKELLVQKP